MKRALFRCEASKAIGTGHVVRCLTLADAMAKAGWNCVFAVSEETAKTVPVILTARFERILPDDILRQQPFDLLVIDGYQFDASYESALRSNTKKILVIDDLTDRQHDADLLMDQTYGRKEQDYKSLVQSTCKILTGSRYALLRPQFAEQRDTALAARKSRAGSVERILIFIGGSDPDGVTLKALKAAASLKNIPAIDVIIQSQAAIFAEADKIRAMHPDKIRFLEGVADMATLMSQADLCIGAGGTASWERCSLGLPTIIIEIADNQKMIAANLAAAGVVVNLGWHRDLAPETITEHLESLIANPKSMMDMSANAETICDGQGASRVIKEIEDMTNITLRPVAEGDMNILYQWQTEPDARRYLRNPATPTHEEHKNWLASFLKKTDSFGYIIMDGKTPAGFIRLEPAFENGGYEVSILVGSVSRGRGMALQALDLLARKHADQPLKAFIYPENTASLSLFRKAGFVPESENWYKKQLVV